MITTSEILKRKVSNIIFPLMFLITIILLIIYYLGLSLHIVPEVENKLLESKKDFLYEMSNSMAITLNHKFECEPESVDDTSNINEFLRSYDYGDDNSGYYFLTDKNGIILSHPDNQLLGLNIETLKDNNDFELGKAIMEIARYSGKGYISYNWPKKINSELQIQKFTYIKKFGKEDWILSTGLYIDDVQNFTNETSGYVIKYSVTIIVIMFIILLLLIKIGGKFEKEKNRIEIDYSSLAENLSVGIFRLAIKKFSFPPAYPVMQNSAMMKIFGIQEEERKKMEKGKIHIIKFIKDDKIKKQIYKKVMSKQPIEKTEMEIINKKGENLWITFEGKITKIGKEEFYDGMVEDITKIHKTHELLEKSYEKLKKADLLKDEIIAITGHELRTPLTIIKGFSSILRSDKIGKLSLQQNQYIGNIMNNTDKLLSMINDMLDLSKLEAGEIIFIPKNIILKEFIIGIGKDLSVLAEKDEKIINFNIPSEEINVNYDPQYLKSVITNLISNAVKFTKIKKGIIDINVKIIDKNKVNISISDNGEGISKDNINDIFTKFKQVGGHMKRTSEGTGLGLSLVKVILKQMGTKINVNSVLGEGSTFDFTLNISDKKD